MIQKSSSQKASGSSVKNPLESIIKCVRNMLMNLIINISSSTINNHTELLQQQQIINKEFKVLKSSFPKKLFEVWAPSCYELILIVTYLQLISIATTINLDQSQLL